MVKQTQKYHVRLDTAQKEMCGPFYHGTTTAFGIENMILPPHETGELREPRDINLDAVFLAANYHLAKRYASEAAQKYGGEPIIYQVHPLNDVYMMVNKKTGLDMKTDALTFYTLGGAYVDAEIPENPNISPKTFEQMGITEADLKIGSAIPARTWSEKTDRGKLITGSWKKRVQTPETELTSSSLQTRF